MNWTESDEKQLQDLKEKLSSAPVLSLPDLKKEFDLFVNTEKGIAYGVLTQEWGGYRKPVAFLSKLLDPGARGWPACLQAVAAAAILIEEVQKLTLQGKIKIHTPHDLKTILSQRAQKWLTDSRILKYEIILINTDNLELTTSKTLNPAQFLSGEPTEEIEHHCLELIDMQTKVREDLEDTPLPYGRVLFTDGSSRVVEGKRTSGYSVIEGEKMEVLEKGKLPSNWSAQCCEIYALKRGLDLLKDDRGTIYTDSRYAFGIVHTFGKIWEGRGYLNSKGKDLIHTELIKSALKSLQKPVEIVVVHIKGHQKGNMPEIRGNQLADQTAREAALEPGEPVKILKLEKIPRKEEEGIEQLFGEKEQKQYQYIQNQFPKCQGLTAVNRKKCSDVLTLQYQPLTIKNTCWLPLDLMLSLERPFQVCSADKQPLPDGQPVTVDAKQTCHLYIAFDPAYKLDFNSWKEKKVLKVEMVRGHPSVEQITLWGEAHFPNLQIQPSTLEFLCIVAGAEEVHSLEMTNCSPLPVKYHGAFQTDSQANRLTYEPHPLKFKPEPPKGTSIYVDNPATQWRRFRTRNVEEPATTLEESRILPNLQEQSWELDQKNLCENLLSPCDFFVCLGDTWGFRGTEYQRKRLKREIPTSPGIIGYVNVPINTSDVRAFKKEMGKLMDDPLGVSERLDEFLGTSIYSYEDLTAILRSLFNTEERELIRQAGIREWERRNPQSTPGDQKWPSQDPRWNAQTEEGRRSMIDMRNIIIQGIREAVPRGQNLSKVFGECQGKDETPTEWLDRLRKSLQIYSGTDPDSPVGEVLLKTQFVAKSWEDIRKKLEKIEGWQENGLQELLREAQKIYMRRDEEKQKIQARVLVAAVREAQKQERPQASEKPLRKAPPKGPTRPQKGTSGNRMEGLECFYCKKKGHMKRDCPKRIRDEKMFRED
ncbi:hypothetical protein DUI87_19296 [Hirundo rustica rustica]|uniref:CCHC-type domain-containing protein n=1 Tax=Hirundo rustica rustica TaxID=333673 RepID=A0A3M0JT22_HIRRU|nr:hypothetical protein DUI87_19296 [Hirundo rustica rustica]